MENSSGPSIEPYVTPFEIRRRLKMILQTARMDYFPVTFPEVIFFYKVIKLFINKFFKDFS